MNTRYFYQDKPLFGLDLGFNSAKVIQITPGHHMSVTGYGVTRYPSESIKDGVIVDHETVAKSLHELFSKHLAGDITTRRAAFSVSSARIFTRVLSLPILDNKTEISEAVRAESEQYIPVPLDDLYLDYSILARNPTTLDVLVVASPKKIIDSYLKLAKMLGLEVVAMEATIGAITRLFGYTSQHDIPTILIDFGSVASDITIYDNQLVVTGTVSGGGDDFARLISQKLGVTYEEAQVIKVKYGLNVSKRQKEIKEALDLILQDTIKEIKRMVRYYEERTNDQKKQIGQIVTLGGGANVPGLSEYLTDTLRLPVRMCNPWEQLRFHGIKPPSEIDKSMYITAAGLALINPKELFE